MILVGIVKAFNTRDIGKLKKYVCTWFFLWGGGTGHVCPPPQAPPRSYAPVFEALGEMWCYFLLNQE